MKKLLAFCAIIAGMSIFNFLAYAEPAIDSGKIKQKGAEKAALVSEGRDTRPDQEVAADDYSGWRGGDNAGEDISEPVGVEDSSAVDKR